MELKDLGEKYPFLGQNCKQVMIYSEIEARKLSHGTILPEHMLVGMLIDPQNVGGHILREHGLTAEIMRLSIERSLGHGFFVSNETIPFSEKSDMLLSKNPQSLQYPLELRHHFTGTEHILYGILNLPKTDPTNNFLKRNNIDERRLMEQSRLNPNEQF